MKVPRALQAIMFGHAAFQFLYAGVQLNLFTTLHSAGPLDIKELREKLRLDYRPLRGLLLGVRALRLVELKDEKFSNADSIAGIIDGGWWKEFVDTLRFEAVIVYPGLVHLCDSLKSNSNKGIATVEGDEDDLYRRLEKHPDRLNTFFDYMGSWSRIAQAALLEDVPWTDGEHILDVGGGEGENAIALASKFEKSKITIIDLPNVCKIAERRVRDAGLADRISIKPCNFRQDPIPTTPDGYDTAVFIHQLVIWPSDTCTKLLRDVRAVLKPPVGSRSGGRAIVFNSISDADFNGPLTAALDNAYFLSLPSKRGFIHAFEEYRRWFEHAGYVPIRQHRVSARHTWTPHGYIIAEVRN